MAQSTISFNVIHNGLSLEVQEHYVASRNIYVIKYPDKSTLQITRAEIPGGKIIWISIGIDRHQEAAAIGQLIETHIKNNGS